MRIKNFSRAIIVVILLVATPAVYGAPLTNLDFLKQLSTGTHQFQADSQTFDAHVDNDGTLGWLLVGRGREGWAWNNAGTAGAPTNVNQNLGTSSAFTPEYYSSPIINDLITNSSHISGGGIDLTNLEIRIRRATDQAGTTFQEDRWIPTTETSWRWNFDTQYSVTHEILPPGGPNGSQTVHNANTRDEGPNDARRIFTWAWGGHNNEQGFSYGLSVSNGANNATSFLWEFGNEQHAIPYTEIYIRNLNEPNDLLPSAVPEPSSIVMWSLMGLGGVGFAIYRRRRTR